MKPSGIGGMAVFEGVMMKYKDEYAVAVRKPNNEIIVEKRKYKDFSDKVKFFKLPIFRGMLAFVDSIIVGFKVINFSANFFEDEEFHHNEKKDKKSNSMAGSRSNKKMKKNSGAKQKGKKEKRVEALLMAMAILVSILISVALFMVLPVLVSNLFSKTIENNALVSLLVGILRLIIFIGYVVAVAHMPEIKRVFMYHGAEHKTINCLENGFDLTVENIKWQSKQHERCGTSFLILVMILCLIYFIFFPMEDLLWRIISRVLFVPIMAGVTYEFIHFLGKSKRKIVKIIRKPGLLLQGLTTKEPDDRMIAVAIQSVEAIFDWRSFLEASAADETKNAITSKKRSGKTKKERSNHNNNMKDTEKQSTKPKFSEEEDDEILKALDKYFNIEKDATYHNEKTK